MAEAILLTLRETWSGYVEGLRLVIPRLLAMLSVVLAGWLIAAARPRGHREGARLAAPRSPRGADGHRGAAAQVRAAPRGAPRRLRRLLGALPRLPPRRPRRARLQDPGSAAGRGGGARPRAVGALADPRRGSPARQRGLAHRAPRRGERRLALGARRQRAASTSSLADDRGGDGTRPRRPRPADRPRRLRDRRGGGDAGPRHRGGRRGGAARPPPARGADLASGRGRGRTARPTCDRPRPEAR
jgi:hypothetical protein